MIHDDAPAGNGRSKWNSGAGVASAYITLVPIFGVLFAALLLGEQIDTYMALGGCLAVGGLGVMNLARRPSA